MAAKKSSDFKPRLGQVVSVEILEPQPRPARKGPGRPPEPVRVRAERSGRVLQSGDHVTFSTYYQRRIAEGAIRVHPVSEDAPAATAE